MSDKNLNNPFDTNEINQDAFQEKTNLLLDQLENLSDAIYHLNAQPNPLLSDLPLLITLSNDLQLSPLQTAIVSRVAMSNPDCDSATERSIVRSFTTFYKGRRGIIQQAIEDLIFDKIICRDHERDSDNTLSLTHRYKSALNIGDIKAILALRPTGLLPFLKNFIDVVIGERHEHPFGMMLSPFQHISQKQLGIERNENLACVKYMHKLIENRHQGDIGILMFLAVLAKRVVVDEPLQLSDFFHLIDKPHWETKSFKKTEIHTESWIPFTMGYFEIVGKDLLDDDLEIGLTDEGISALLPELSAEVLESLLEAKEITVPHKSPDKIPFQKLLFDADTAKQLQPIHKLMQPKIREKINKRTNNNKQGMSILLYGYPGTGKTEFCLQLAKEHNMPVMEVNVAQIQNKWVGESEKNARKLFRQYEKLRKQSKRECILLFNEADALFSRRVNVNSSVDAMNNALKNIFLEEMENLNGVILATTNLTGNLDPAFERRFLFKVGFERPNEETTTKIWQQYFKGLPQGEAANLAKRYDFSPGEISNVQRKYVIDKTLGSSLKRYDLILSIAGNEKIQSQSLNTKKAVGFG